VTRASSFLGRTTLLAALALASCTSSFQVWRDPSYRPEPVKRVFVVADGPDQDYRQRTEDAVARRLLGAGYQVATASAVAAPGHFDVDRPDPALTQQLATIGRNPEGTNLDLAKVLAYSRQEGVDLAILLRISRASCESYAQPGCMTADAKVFAIRRTSDAPVWADVLSASEFDRIDDGAGAIADRLVGDLTKAGILVRG
jgi:hypothetical protein